MAELEHQPCGEKLGQLDLLSLLRDTFDEGLDLTEAPRKIMIWCRAEG